LTVFFLFLGHTTIGNGTEQKAMEIIKIDRNGSGDNVVSARGLHGVLERGQHFMDWIKTRIEKYGFVENQDFTSFHNVMKREKGATTRIEYAL